MQKNKKSLTQMPGDSKRQRADTNLTRAQEERLFRESEAARKEKLREERNERNPPTVVERGIKRGLQKLKKAVGLKSGGKLNMVTGPNGKMVPDYATDGVGKMSYGGKAKVKKMNYGGTARTLASKARSRKRYGVDSKYEDRGTSGKNEARKEKQSIEKEYNKDKELIKKYGKDAMKAKGFAKTTDAERVSRFSYGGKAKVKKMGYGGGVKKMGGGGQCRGMGAATSGGKFKMG